jgi:hypothetical protein
MFDGSMFFQLKGLAMEAPINGDTPVLVERSTHIHDMLNDFHTSIGLLCEVNIRFSRDPVEFIDLSLLQERKCSGYNPTNFIKLSY